MVIYECDKCGAQSRNGSTIVNVTVDVKSNRVRKPYEFHLCQSCETALVLAIEAKHAREKKDENNG